MKITPDYQRLNADLHRTRKGYGTGGHRWASWVREQGMTDVLDYGCGKGTLADALDFPIQQYDPCVPGKSMAPKPAALVVCTDVLEHVEPACLDAVLGDLRWLTKTRALLVISLVKSDKNLSDGRNSHLIIRSRDWWRGALETAGFTILEELVERGSGSELAVVVC